LKPVEVVFLQEPLCDDVFLHLSPYLFSAFRLALIQLAVGEDKVENVSRALSFIKKAKEDGSHLIALPECFNSPYGTSECGLMLWLENFKSCELELWNSHCVYIQFTESLVNSEVSSLMSS
jgi:hypothetical protein